MRQWLVFSAGTGNGAFNRVSGCRARGFFHCILCTLLALAAINLGAGEGETSGELEISARAAVLMDRSSHRVLLAKNGHERLPMASTTKIMTGLLALEKGGLDSPVVVSERAAHTGGSSIWLEPGEVKTLEELVYGLMLRSGNDAAVAIAEHLAGSVEDFSVMMTERARELGAHDTSFKNPHGLHHEEHFTTAHDLALITSHALAVPRLAEIIRTVEKRISWPGHPWDRFLRNQNRLLEAYPGGDGVKTGWTTPAGRCFVGSATRDSWQLVAVVLDAPDMWNDAEKLLDFGYREFIPRRLVSHRQFILAGQVKGGAEEKVRLLAGEGFHFPFREGEDRELGYRVKTREELQAPLSEGEVLGELIITLGGEEIKRIDLVAGESVGRKSFFQPLRAWLTRWVSYAA